MAVPKEILLNPDKIIISKTDPKGIITYINEYFCEVSGYSQSELIGANHNIIRHPDMPAIIFKMLWSTIRTGENFRALIKNLCKGGDYYWVLADIKPHIDPVSKSVEYYTGYRRAVNESASKSISKLYKLLKEKENTGGMDSSQLSLDDHLKLNGFSYEEYIDSLVSSQETTVEQSKSMFNGFKNVFSKK